MTDCVHHWVIETPDGPTSAGTCKKCGSRRYDFDNSGPVVTTMNRSLEGPQTMGWWRKRKDRDEGD